MMRCRPENNFSPLLPPAEPASEESSFRPNNVEINSLFCLRNSRIPQEEFFYFNNLFRTKKNRHTPNQATLLCPLVWNVTKRSHHFGKVIHPPLSTLDRECLPITFVLQSHRVTDKIISVLLSSRSYLNPKLCRYLTISYLYHLVWLRRVVCKQIDVSEVKWCIDLHELRPKLKFQLSFGVELNPVIGGEFLRFPTPMSRCEGSNFRLLNEIVAATLWNQTITNPDLENLRDVGPSVDFQCHFGFVFISSIEIEEHFTGRPHFWPSDFGHSCHPTMCKSWCIVNWCFSACWFRNMTSAIT